MLSIYPAQKSRSESQEDRDSSPEVLEIEDEQMISMCEEIQKLRRGTTQDKFDFARVIGSTVLSQPHQYFHERTSSAYVVMHESGNANDFDELELSADNNVGKLPLMQQYTMEKRSRVLRRLIDGIEEEEANEPDTNTTMSLYNTQQSMNKSITNRSLLNKSKPAKNSLRKNQTYVFRKNKNGSLTRYDSKILVDGVDDNASVEIADYTLRIQHDVMRNRPTSDLLISRFDKLFDPSSYK